MSDKAKAKAAIAIDDIMTRDVRCITPEMTVQESIQLLVTYKISGAPMVDKFKKVISVVSEGDLLKLAAYEGVGKKMASCLERLPKTENLMTLSRTATFADAYKMFLTKSVHRIIITDANGHIQGIVSRSNVLKILAEAGVPGSPTAPETEKADDKAAG